MIKIYSKNIFVKMKNPKYDQLSKKLQSGLFGFRVKQRRFTFIVTLLIIIGGVFAVMTIPKESAPEIEFGVISITTIYQWATPQDVDNLITEKIEKSVRDIEWVSKVSCTSNAWVSNVIVEFKNDADMLKATTDVKDAVDNINLPSDSEDPKIQDVSFNKEVMFSIILYWDDSQFDSFYIKEKWRLIKNNLEWKEWINRIDFDSSMQMAIGAFSKNSDSFYDIQVLIDKEKSEEIWINLMQISQSIKSWNANQPIWTHIVWELGYDFRIQWELNDIQELWETPIQTMNEPIKLKEISIIQKNLKKILYKKCDLIICHDKISSISLSTNKNEQTYLRLLKKEKKH